MALREYFNDRADSWDENVAEKDTARLERMSKRIGLKPGSRVLDVGTGTGVFLPYILEKIGEEGRIFALDIAEEMLKKAREKDFGENIEYHNADVMDIPLDSGICDYVVCYSSFPHFRDKPKALREMNRVMKNGSKLVICHTSSRDHINEIHSRMPDVKDDLLPDVSDMHLMLTDAGFSEIRIEEDGESYYASAVKP